MHVSSFFFSFIFLIPIILFICVCVCVCVCERGVCWGGGCVKPAKQRKGFEGLGGEDSLCMTVCLVFHLISFSE